MYTLVFFFFFFQAEDGIRDKLVTGVQTCALPISDGVPPGGPACHADRIQELVRGLTRGCYPAGVSTGPAPFLPRCGRYVSWPEAAWWGRTTRGRRSTSRLTSNHKRTARRLLTSRESGGSSMATPSSIGSSPPRRHRTRPFPQRWRA